MKTPTTLIIMDGFGLTSQVLGNAIEAASTPNLDRLFAENPGCKLAASGLDVGLPEGQIGNREVGHTNIGAGRVVFQDLPRISLDIQEGGFFQNAAYLSAVENCKTHDSALHLFGLLSDGGVHSHIEHLYALLELAKRQGLSRVYIHAFLDGRDVAPTSGKDFVAACAAKCRELGVGSIATVSAATTPWTGTTAGSASRRPMTPSCWARACKTPTQWPPCRTPTTRRSPTSSWSPWCATPPAR